MMRSNWFKLTLSAAVVSTGALLLAACGDKTTDPVVSKVATEDAKVAVTAATIPVLYTAPVQFTAGVPELGTTTATSLSFAKNDTNTAKPLFTVKTATDSAKGTTTFGSCIFTVTQSTFVAPNPLVNGAVVTINPCEVNLPVAGKEVGAEITGVTGSFKLGATASGTVAVDKIVIDANTGAVTVTQGDSTISAGSVGVGVLTGT